MELREGLPREFFGGEYQPRILILVRLHAQGSDFLNSM
jgi:hypothetical protein